jgi:F-type H+-transporting ATPase subunit b
VNITLTIFGQVIAFAIFVWFCLKFVWPPIMRALDARAKAIADGLAAAERGRRELEQAEQRSQELVRTGREQANQIVAHAQKRGDEIVEEAKQDAKAEGERLRVAARAEIDQAIAEAREKLKAEVANLAITGAEQILMREVDRKAHEELLEKIVTRL